MRAQSVCGGSRSLGRAGRASGTSQTLLLISSFTIGDFSISNCRIVQNFESIEKYFNILIEGRGNIGLL